MDLLKDNFNTVNDFSPDVLLALATHSNPAIFYLYQEIEKTDSAFEELHSYAEQVLGQLSYEFNQLQDDILKLLQRLSYEEEKE